MGVIQQKNNRINSLSPVLINKIAAGEVIEAPYSVIKELIENALDAQADCIRIETTAAGMDRIFIEDNGVGIHADDLALSIERHATSKISHLDDLDSLISFGFRGEALASVSSVSHLTIQSKTKDSSTGNRLECRGGIVTQTSQVACKTGTTITVEELFYATPARRKYIKSERSENMRNAKEIEKIALAYPSVRFTYTREDKEKFDFLQVNDLRERIGQIYHKKLLTHLIEIDFEENGMRLHGFIADENYYRANRDGQYLYINKRSVEIKNFSYYVKKAYGELLPSSSHPLYFLFLEIEPERVDMNVHPQKKEVRLVDERMLHNLVQHAIAPLLRPIDPLGYLLSKPVSSEPEVLSHSLENHTEPMFAQPFLNSQSWPVSKPQAIQESESNFKDHVSSPGKNIENKGTVIQDDVLKVRSSFVPVRHFGTIFGTYILAEGEDGLYIVDQHTAHERVNYEKKRKELESQKDSKQKLLTPVILDISRDEKEEMLSHSQKLSESGFSIEDFGPACIAIREVPTYIDPGSESEILMHLMQRITEGETSIKLYDEYAALKACKASIRKNDYVAGGVISSILMELAACENPSRCPHGRPTMIKITQNELDKMFHRI